MSRFLLSFKNLSGRVAVSDSFPYPALPPEARFSFMAPPGLAKTCHTLRVGGEGRVQPPHPDLASGVGRRGCVSLIVCVNVHLCL